MLITFCIARDRFTASLFSIKDNGLGKMVRIEKGKFYPDMTLDGAYYTHFTCGREKEWSEKRSFLKYSNAKSKKLRQFFKTFQKEMNLIKVCRDFLILKWNESLYKV